MKKLGWGNLAYTLRLQLRTNLVCEEQLKRKHVSCYFEKYMFPLLKAPKSTMKYNMGFFKVALAFHYHILIGSAFSFQEIIVQCRRFIHGEVHPAQQELRNKDKC